jgi:hypothetical protein
MTKEDNCLRMIKGRMNISQGFSYYRPRFIDFDIAA